MLTPQLEDRLERNIVWVFPSPGGGNLGLLTRFLSSKTLVMDQPLVGHRFVKLEETLDGYVRTIDVHSKRQVFFFNHLYADTWKYYLRKLILNRIYAQYKDLDHKIVIKEPTGAVADVISGSLPNSKLLLMTRDPRESIIAEANRVNANNSRAGPKAWENLDFVKKQAKLWKAMMEFTMTAFENHPNDLRMLVKYEDLHRNALDTVKQIYKFIDVPITDEELKKAVPSSKAQEVISNMLENLLHSLEYVNHQSNSVHSRRTGDTPFPISPIQERNFQIQIQGLTPEQEDRLESNLVWIFSNPRSGTTWLGTQLLSHNTLSMDEPQLGSRLVDSPDYPDPYLEGDLKQKTGYFFNHLYADTWKYYLRKLILNRIYAQYKDLDHKIVIKEPTGGTGSYIVMQSLPRSKLIVVARDGRDTIDSIIDSLKPGGWSTKVGDHARESFESMNRRKFIDGYAKLWRVLMEFTMTAFENHPNDLRMLVKYEELRTNTSDIVRQIYKFIDVPITEGQLTTLVEKYQFEKIPEALKGKGKFYRSATPGMWKQNFSDQEKQLMNSIMNSTLERFGYAI